MIDSKKKIRCVIKTQIHSNSRFDTHSEESPCRFAVRECLSNHWPGIQSDGFLVKRVFTVFVKIRYNITVKHNFHKE